MGLVIQYIKGMIPYCMIGMMLYIIIRTRYYRKTNRKVEWNREIIALLFVAYISGLASQTIMPRWNFGIISATGEPYFDIYWSN